MTCPAGFACNVKCTGKNSCQSTVIDCPNEYACVVLCQNQQGGIPAGCEGTTVNCSLTGTCELDCFQGNNPQPECYTGGTPTKLNCGGNSCTARCMGATDKPSVNCGGACSCTHC